MGLLTAFVGFASSFAVVLHGLTGVGATEAQAASGLMALSVSMGLCAIVLSALDATTGEHSLVDTGCRTPCRVRARWAAGSTPRSAASSICGALIVVAGLWKPLGRAVAAIPAALANAMLAGVLIGLCFAPVKAIAFNPLLGLPIVACLGDCRQHQPAVCGARSSSRLRSGAGLRRRYAHRCDGTAFGHAGSAYRVGHASLHRRWPRQHCAAAVHRHHGIPEYPGHRRPEGQRL